MSNQIDLTVEDAITLKAACRLPELKRDGKPLHLATIFRWASRGVRGVVLETMQQGASKVTTREAIDRFFAKLGGEIDTDAKVPGRTPLRRKRDHERADKELAGAGW
jgi:hypothetical protein